MQKIGLEQKLTQKLSPHQIQFMKLLQVPAAAMQSYIEQEVAHNPLLTTEVEEKQHGESEGKDIAELQGDIFKDNQPTYYQFQYLNTADKKISRDVWTPTTLSLHETLLEQLNFLNLNKRQQTIGIYLIGSIEADGYIHCTLETIVNDLNTMHYLATNVAEVAIILKKIQLFDPPGIGARDLQECILLQLKKLDRKDNITIVAQQIITQCFDLLKKRHYAKIAKKLLIEDINILQQAIGYITKLNPKPGSHNEISPNNEILKSDFFIMNDNGQLTVELLYYYMPPLKINKGYIKILASYQEGPREDPYTKQIADFIKKKLESAQWFMDAIKQRNETLLKTMKSILKFQHAFFEEEEEKNLRPMILKDIARDISMDISTISRIVNNKSVQTKFGIYPLKFFFSEGISTTSGDEISNKAIKKIIVELINKEDKKKPYSDDKISRILQKEGYYIARRTVAKYRAQLQLPVARLRRGV